MANQTCVVIESHRDDDLSASSLVAERSAISNALRETSCYRGPIAVIDA